MAYVANLAAGWAGAYYYTDAELDSSSVILAAPLAAMGLSAEAELGLAVAAFDHYYTGTPENVSASPSQTGLLLYRTSDPRNEAQTVAVH